MILVASVLSACAKQAPTPSRDNVAAQARAALCAQIVPAHDDDRRAREDINAAGEEARVTRAFAFIAAARREADPGYYLNAEACAEEVLAQEPDNLAARNVRAIVLLQRHRFDDALREARAVLQTEPENLLALGNASDAAMELGQYDLARDYANLQLRQRVDMASLGRGAYLRWLSNDTDTARRMLRDALRLRDAHDPEAAAWTFVDAANVYWQRGDADGADALAVEALNWLADYPPALVMRARVALARGEAATATTLLQRAVKRRPLVETLWLLGDARAMAGDSAGAEQAYDEALRLGRRDDRLMLGLFLAERGEHLDEALAALQAERATRQSIAVDDAYALALYRVGRLDEARAMSDRAVRLNTPDARLYFHRGLILFASGETAQARAAWDRARAINPAFVPVDAALARRWRETMDRVAAP